MTLDTALSDPTEARAYHYYEAVKSLNELLDADALCSDKHGWDDVFVLLRQVASRRKAEVITATLNDLRSAMTRAATQQTIADGWTDPADADARNKDAEIQQFLAEDR